MMRTSGDPRDPTSKEQNVIRDLAIKGSFSVNGTSYPKHSVVWSDWDESVDVTAPPGTEVLRFEFAEVDS